ncbi:MAG: hypothetical protein AMS17_18455 [Spirochaetes bacterium DG_61]|jgi:ATP-dependent Zn protease|nr:MAG: hypothetical protein AMS17_18455 [Spirochaetes bacterium DG_61]
MARTKLLGKIRLVTAEMIEEEVCDILAENYNKAKKLINEDRDVIEPIAWELIQVEVMDEKSFARLLEMEAQPVLK